MQVDVEFSEVVMTIVGGLELLRNGFGMRAYFKLFHEITWGCNTKLFPIEILCKCPYLQ